MSPYAAAAAMEALQGAAQIPLAGRRLGIIFCVTAGCVQYSRRFYDETWKNPATASPVLFPETVFNAPASHLSALLESSCVNYTLVGDPGTFLQALALAAGWLSDGRVDSCLVVGAEELDWLTADAYRRFSRGAHVRRRSRGRLSFVPGARRQSRNGTHCHYRSPAVFEWDVKGTGHPGSAGGIAIGRTTRRFVRQSGWMARARSGGDGGVVGLEWNATFAEARAGGRIDGRRRLAMRGRH